MSCKTSLLLTSDDEHWYSHFEKTDDYNDRFVVEINKKNITEIDTQDDFIIIELNGNSELAKILVEMSKNNKGE